MCRAVPGRVESVEPNALGMTQAQVRFGDTLRRVNVGYLGDVAVGDYVMVHLGFAFRRVDEEEAQEVLALLGEIEDVSEVAIPPAAC